MPKAEHSRIVPAPLSDVWAYVRDMDNWAPLVTGYQRHEKLGDRESYWYLKGDLGGLTRIAEFKVQIDEWDDAGHVAFSLRGVNEPVTGSGSFDAVALEPADPTPAPEPPRPGLLFRWRDAIARFLLGRVFGRRDTAASTPARDDVGRARSQITFKLSLAAGGAAGVILNALMTPMMKPVAEDLADKIAAAITSGARAAS
jgi:carbon monoxide dehydrogenase subunit G